MKQDLQPEAVALASYPPRLGNAVRVMIDGEESFGRIFDTVSAAKRSVWVTVSFAQIDTPLPGRKETFRDLITRVAARGVDVRLLFWWSEYPGIGSFRGEPHELDELRAHGCRAKMRWDAVPRGCHHQKSYVVDGELAFVGGINVTREALSSQAHDGSGFHDVFCELSGPAVADVAANFAQRWNQASVTSERTHAFPDLIQAGDLDGVHIVPAGAGTSAVQVVRTLRHDLYTGTAGWAPEHRFELAAGEESVRSAVLCGLAAARRTLYIENQFFMDPDTIDAVAEAARRGVEVVIVLPLDPDPNLLLYPEEKMRQTRGSLERLGTLENVGLFGLVREAEPDRSIYVHAKLMIADDTVIQLGSANLWPPSYFRDSELNIVVWDARIAADLRGRLWHEHLCGRAAEGLVDWRRWAAEGTAARRAGLSPPTRIVRIDPARYYVFPEGTLAPWHGAREAS